MTRRKLIIISIAEIIVLAAWFALLAALLVFASAIIGG